MSWSGKLSINKQQVVSATFDVFAHETLLFYSSEALFVEH
jgi:hypothetical protein